MMNSMKWLVVAALLFVAGPMVSCGDDEAEIECEGGLTKVALTSNCQVFADRGCACNPLPADTSEADCKLVGKGKACFTSEEAKTLTDDYCKLVVDAINRGEANVCR